MEQEPSWSVQQQSLSNYSHQLAAAAADAAATTSSPGGINLQSHYTNPSTNLHHSRQDLCNQAILDHTVLTGGYNNLLDAVPRDAFLSCMTAANSINPDHQDANDVNLAADSSNMQAMQSLREFMAVGNYGNPNAAAAAAAAANVNLTEGINQQQYIINQDMDQDHLIDPRSSAISAGSLPSFYFNLINDDASASPASAAAAAAAPNAVLRSSPASNRPDILMNYRNQLYSGDIFGAERSPYRTQIQRESHILAERQRREEMNEKFTILRTMIPKLTKKDKASIVSDTINYIKELEKKASYLQACKEKTKGFVNIRQAPNKRSEGSLVGATIDKALIINQTSETRPIKEALSKGGDQNSLLSNAVVDLSMQPKEDGDHPKRVKLGQVEIEDLGSQAVIKVLSARSRGVVLRLHLALEECKVDVIQSNVTTVGDNMVHFITVGLDPGISAAMNELAAALQVAAT